MPRQYVRSDVVVPRQRKMGGHKSSKRPDRCMYSRLPFDSVRMAYIESCREKQAGKIWSDSPGSRRRPPKMISSIVSTFFNRPSVQLLREVILKRDLSSDQTVSSRRPWIGDKEPSKLKSEPTHGQPPAPTLHPNSYLSTTCLRPRIRDTVPSLGK